MNDYHSNCLLGITRVFSARENFPAHFEIFALFLILMSFSSYYPQNSWNISVPSYQNNLDYGNSISYPTIRAQPAMLKSVKLVTPFFSSSVPDNPILIQTVPSASSPSHQLYPLNTTSSTPSNIYSVGLFFVLPSQHRKPNPIIRRRLS